MKPLFEVDFTAMADSSRWPSDAFRVRANNGVDSRAYVAAGAGVLAIGSTADYNRGIRIEPTVNVTDRFEISARYQMPPSGVRLHIGVRTTSDGWGSYNSDVGAVGGSRFPSTGLFFTLDGKGALGIDRRQGGTFTSLAGGVAPSGGTWFCARIQVIGQRFQSKVWRDTDPEPESWARGTDRVLPARGKLVLVAADSGGRYATVSLSRFRVSELPADAVLPPVEWAARQDITVDMPSLAPGVITTVYAQVPGADAILTTPAVGFSGAGLTLLNSYPMGDGRVALVVYNPTAAPIDRPAETWYFWSVR